MIGYQQALAVCRSDPEAAARLLCEFSRQLDQLKEEVAALKAENVALRRECQSLCKKIRALEEKVALNSHNSSKPPSSDGYQKPAPKSLRKKSDRPSGGQPGHPGKTLAMVEAPDLIEMHRVQCCACCGRSLEDRPPESIERRQVFALPPIRLTITEHQAESKRCSCGHLNQAAFPEGVNAPVQYGPDLEALAVYLNNYQMLPYERTCELLADLFGCPISQGTLANIILQCQDLLKEPVQRIKERIGQAPVAHFDETGSRVEGKCQWLHTACTETATYYAIQPKRGGEALDAIGILPGFRGRAIHDFWRPYLKYGCAHGLCNAHHLRELTFLHDQCQEGWAEEMIDCLLEIKDAVDRAKPTADCLLERDLRAFEARYQHILGQGYAANLLPREPAGAEKKRGRRKKTKPRNLLERLDHHREKVLAFMYDFLVPFDNNLAERAIRMMKVQQKISGMFRSKEGAEAFCHIRSYIATARKNAIGIMEALAGAFSGTPFVPSLT